MYNLSFLIIVGIFLFSACNPKTITYHIKGETENMNNVKYAYLYIERNENNDIDYLYYPFWNEVKPLHTFELKQCPLLNNKFSFKGKVNKSIKNPFTTAYLFLDTVANFSKESLKLRARSDRHVIILNDKTITVTIKNNLMVNQADIFAGKYTGLYNEVESIKVVRKKYYYEDLKIFMAYIRRNTNSITSLCIIQDNLFPPCPDDIPIDSLKLAASLLSPKMKRTATYKDIEDRFFKYDNELIMNEIYEGRKRLN